MFTIGKLASLTGVSNDTLRYYEQEGLVEPAGKSPAGYRLYDKDSARRVHFIKHAQNCGFTLAEIRELNLPLRQLVTPSETVGKQLHDLQPEFDDLVRRAGVSVELAADRKVTRAMELANKSGARYALIVGDNEIAVGKYALKNMKTGEQKNVTRDEICNQVSH